MLQDFNHVNEIISSNIKYKKTIYQTKINSTTANTEYIYYIQNLKPFYVLFIYMKDCHQWRNQGVQTDCTVARLNGNSEGTNPFIPSWVHLRYM